MRILCIPVKMHILRAKVNIDSGFFKKLESEDGLAHYLEHIIAKHLIKSIIEQLQKKNIYLILQNDMFRTNYRIYEMPNTLILLSNSY